MSDSGDENSLPGEGTSEEQPLDELLPSGNPPRWLRGGGLLLLGVLWTLCVMAFQHPLRWGVLLGGIGVLLASLGALDLIGSFDDPDASVVHRCQISDALLPLLCLLLSGSWSFTALLFATRGSLNIFPAAFLVTSGAIATIVSLFFLGKSLGPWATDETGNPRPLLRRHGFWVVAAACALYLPAAGAHSLTDPWETHYGEVSREILARNDWISTWWAQDGWFFSKPVLNFWIQALSMSALGVHYQPGAMLDPAGGAIPRPEWAVRLPVVLFATIALYLLYKGVARVFGRRAGLLGALVLMTMPQWSFLSHQTMADMPFVAAMAASMGLLLSGVHTDTNVQVRVYETRWGVGKIRWSAFHLVFGLVLVSALPQVLYLLSRNVELQLGDGGLGFRWHGDIFWSGSAGNCGLPGNEVCAQHRPFNPWFQPGLQGLFWGLALGALLYLNWGERRTQRLYYIAAFFFASLATLGKGPAGLLFPVLCAGLYVVVTGRWREMTRFEILSGALIVLAVALPWYLAMYLRHGPSFVDRLIFHDMWKRALSHVHDTNEGDDVSFRYYLWQLGYAMFPWSGLAPLGLIGWARRPDDADKGRGDASVMLAMWFVLAFTLFGWMQTKFHHYIFPAVPPAAMLIGILLDRLWGEHRAVIPSVIAGCAGALLGVAGWLFFPGSMDGSHTSQGDLLPAIPALGAAVLLASITLLLVAGFRASESKQATPLRDSVLSAALLTGIPILALVGRDLSSRPPADVIGEARLLYLFTYNYRRPWPESLDFTAVLWGITIAALLLTLLLAVDRLRRVAIAGLLGLSVVFCTWCLDVYFVKTAPHWGQRETIAAYYRLRSGPQEPIVAYRMNWKGENFYTGNRLPAFVASGERFKEWVKEQRERGVTTLFFTTEFHQVGSLRSELGNPDSLEVLTDRSLNNKFTLVRVRF